MISEKAKLKLQVKSTKDLQTLAKIITEELDYRFEQDITNPTNNFNPIYKKMIEQGKV